MKKGFIIGESVLVLNSIEKQIAMQLIEKLDSGDIVSSKDIRVDNAIRSRICYEYRSTKEGKILAGLMLDCPFKLRYRDNDHVYFSAFNCKDVCSVFYDVFLILCMMSGRNEDVKLFELHDEINVDLNVERYVFFTGELAGLFIDMMDDLIQDNSKISNSSQYVIAVFYKQDFGVYDELVKKIKADGYSNVCVLQIWIRGEIFYFAIADGLVLRPEHQRGFNSKEEKDLIRKMYKSLDKNTPITDFKNCKSS
jgi:hypothetical protein